MPEGKMLRTETERSIATQLATHRIEFGKRYRDTASGFEGEVCGLYFFKHGCLRVNLRGKNDTTGEPAEFCFDAPELVEAVTATPVPAGGRKGGPRDLTPPHRPGGGR